MYTEIVYLLISDVRNILNKCSAESPCEANTGDCTLDNECRGRLVCTRSNYEGPNLLRSTNFCKEPGDDIFYISGYVGLKSLQNGGYFFFSQVHHGNEIETTVVCIKVRTASFPRFWKNHP